MVFAGCGCMLSAESEAHLHDTSQSCTSERGRARRHPGAGAARIVVGAGSARHHQRHGAGCVQRGHTGRIRDDHQRRHGHDRWRSSPTTSAGSRRRTLLPGSLHGCRRALGLQEVRSRSRGSRQRPARARHPARGRGVGRDRHCDRGHAAPRDDERVARPGRRCAADLGAADAARRSLRAHRPGQRRVVHRVGAARPSLRAHPHRRLRDGRHARQPQRPDDRRRAEHGDGQRGRGDRVLRAARRYAPGVQGPDRDVRRRLRQHRRGRDEPEHQVGHQLASRNGVLQQDAAKLFANDFFANANNIPLSDFSYNRYGGTAGGPVLLPGYDGRSRTFFLYGFEGIHEARPRNNGTPTVPTAKMRTGDFSELLALGPQYQIYNPFTRRAIGGGRFQQDPFPGNIIPPGLINPVARKVLDYIPLPLTAGRSDGTNNFQNPGLLEEIKYASNTHPRRSRRLGQTARVRARQLVRPEQQLQQLFRQPGHGRVVQVRVPAGRVRPRVRRQPEHGPEHALRLQLVRARHRLEP